MEYIAVLDLGSSKMKAIVARKDNRQELLASVQTVSGNGIRRGLVYNSEEAAGKIVAIIQELNKRLKVGIKQVYVGIGGQGLHSQACSIQKAIDGAEIDQFTINDIDGECQENLNVAMEIIDIVSPEYYLDGVLEANPEGIACETIEAKYQAIAGHSFKFQSEVEKALQRINVKVAGYLVAPIATASAVLTDKERKAGCALVEIGAEITSLSIYKDGLLRYLRTIPLGSGSITKDLIDADKTEVEAEEWKLNEGNALPEEKEEDIYRIVPARAKEIIDNICKQIDESGYKKETLGAGIVLTGGGSLLKNIDQLLTQESKQTVRKVENPAQSCAMGLLKLGKENCSLPEPVKIEPPTVAPQDEEGDYDLFGGFFRKPKKKKTKPKENKPQPQVPVPNPKETTSSAPAPAQKSVLDKIVKGLFEDQE
ncbi:MAG: Cell division protein FtsA [Candidatus Ordinivivax streblomastigis]|uniref:Cell division protein FtsA n=1 Tax=Candidatus Ordinivivax streblomastigis TaxID=2540710 RepID=A0A5M8P210_9BACT|nr:MAG: Cell division protein FtsA [Candidatus Ordinivivax streblomastigis]